MKYILIARKVDKKTNIEFKGTLKCNLFDRIIMKIFGISNEFKITRDDLVRVVTNGTKYYTQNTDGSLTEVEVVNYNKKYLRSVANDGTGDNLDSLPIYQ